MDKVVYELPLNEQVRVLIRLESLLCAFEQYRHNVNSQSMYLALKSLDDILSIMERNNIKKYVLAELNELSIKLGEWRNEPHADASVIDSIVHDLAQHKSNLAEGTKKIVSISSGDFMKSFRQRVNVAGSMSLVDFPRYHFWMRQDLTYAQEKLEEWGKCFGVYYAAIYAVLKLIRQSADVKEYIAKEGFYQEALDKKVNYKLMRVVLPADAACFAEVSGGRYHVTVRMMQDDWEMGMSVYAQDTGFVLEKCRL